MLGGLTEKRGEHLCSISTGTVIRGSELRTSLDNEVFIIGFPVSQGHYNAFLEEGMEIFSSVHSSQLKI